jgi:hypothetical protein
VRPEWFPDWTGEVAAIVAGGESVTPADVEILRGRCRVVVVNNSYQLAPWADLLYAVDDKWWDAHPAARAFAGLKVSRAGDAAKRYKVHTVNLIGLGEPEKDEFTIETPGLIARGGNSGFQATNLILQFGARRILWLGFDCRGEHWHGKHPTPLRNPTPQRLDTWARTFDAQAARLEAIGAEVVNCSAVSAITAYRKMPVADALDLWGCLDRRDVA